MNRLWLKLGVLVFWLSWPALWVYLYRTKRTRLLIVSGGEFLVLRGWLGAGNWNLPGGGLHKGEELLTGLLREVQEETGLAFAKEQIKPLLKGLYHEYGFRFTYDCYVLELPQKPEIKKQRWEIADHAWQPVINPRLKLAQDARAALEKWLSER